MTVTTTDLRKPANRRPARRMTAMLAALTIVLVACSTSPGTDMPNYRTDRPTYQPNSDLTEQSYATTDQVLAAVAAAQQTQVLSDVAAAQLATYGTNSEPGPSKRAPSIASTSVRHTLQLSSAQCSANALTATQKARSKWWSMGIHVRRCGRPPLSASPQSVVGRCGYSPRAAARRPICNIRDYATHGPDPDCDVFHLAAVNEIRKLHPQLVVTASLAGHTLANGQLANDLPMAGCLGVNIPEAGSARHSRGDTRGPPELG